MLSNNVMTRGNLQVAGRNPLEKRIVTISQPRRTSDSDEAEDSLFLSVLRRRWMLLLTCVLASLGVATYMAKQFTMPKADTTGEMRYVSLPPTVLPVYTPPNTLELVDLLRSHEYMSELARRNDLPIDPKRLSELFEIRTSHMSNIISVKLGWGDAQEAIEMVNDLMRIACEKTTANRRETLRNYRRDTEIALASADQRVAEYRDRVLALRRERDQKLREEGTAGSEVQRLTNMLSRVEELLDQAILKKASLSQQLSTVRGEEEGLKAQIKQELLRSRRQQVEDRLRALNRSAPQAARLLSLKKALEEFDAENVVLDYVAWQAKLTLLGREILGDLDPVAMRVVDTLQRQLAYQTQRAEQLELLFDFGTRERSAIATEPTTQPSEEQTEDEVADGYIELTWTGKMVMKPVAPATTQPGTSENRFHVVARGTDRPVYLSDGQNTAECTEL